MLLSEAVLPVKTWKIAIVGEPEAKEFETYLVDDDDAFHEEEVVFS